MIYFTNPGSLPIEAAITLGVNAKEGPSAIGYFGTGLKYAIATILRNHGSISIATDGDTYTFSHQVSIIRNAPFKIVTYSKNGGTPVLTGFTTDMGKNWTLENAYRELYSNAKDEGGDVYTKPPFSTGSCVVITTIGLDEVHEMRDSFILNSQHMKLLLSTPDIEVYNQISDTVFYRGIAAYKSSRPIKYTYNIKRQMTLTEDRTLASPYSMECEITSALQALSDEDFLNATSHRSFLEGNISFYFSDLKESVYDKAEAMLAVIGPENFNQSIANNVNVRKSKKPKTFSYMSISLDEMQMVEEAEATLKASGIYARLYPIKFVHNLGKDTLALAHNGEILLTPKCFSDKALLHKAILEEFVHLFYGVNDNTREMQNVLFNLIYKLVIANESLRPKSPPPAPSALADDEC